MYGLQVLSLSTDDCVSREESGAMRRRKWRKRGVINNPIATDQIPQDASHREMPSVDQRDKAWAGSTSVGRRDSGGSVAYNKLDKHQNVF